MSLLCRACGHNDLRELFSHPDTPLFFGLVAPGTPEDLVRMRLAISLVECGGCRTVQLRPDPDVDAVVDRLYNELPHAGTSAVTGDGTLGRELANRFLEATGLMDMPDRVIEIGCNQGHMLSICKENGARQVVGVEPSAVEERTPAPGIRIIPGYFTADLLRGQKFDLAYMIDVLEHIGDPTDLLRDVREVLDVDGRVAISVPNCDAGLAFGNIGMPIHEHVIYFTPASLTRLLGGTGFEVTKLVTTLSHIYCVARRSDAAEPRPAIDATDAGSFWPECRKRIDQVADFSRAQSGPWGLYGACSLTANLLAWASDIDLESCHIVDSDERKWGHFVSGCPIRTISPADAIEAGVRDVIVMPFGFQENIGQYIGRLFPSLRPIYLYAGLAGAYASRNAS